LRGDPVALYVSPHEEVKVADDLNEQSESQEASQQHAATSPSLLPADAVRNSPEYQELARQNRALARQLGTANRSVADARAEAERARQAAEAERATALESEVRSVLGDDGVAAWSEIAELSATDQVAAAKRFAELMRSAQSRQAEVSVEAQEAQTTAQEAPRVTTQQPSRSVDASVPLSQGTAQPDDAELIESMDRTFAETAARVQDPTTRNRTTERIRSGAIMSYLAARYLQAGARPKG
jgi:hypothetical protein